MSDNSINYDELDKAVNAAMSARETAKAKPAAAPKPAEPKKPASRGMFMDFAPRRSQVIARVTTTTRTVAIKPAARPVAAHPVAPARPAATVRRPAVKPAAPRAAANPAARAAHLAAHPTAKPVARPASAHTIAPAARPAAPAAKPVAKPVAKPASKIGPAPNANNYSLGGRSPFLNPNAQVEKRPLGANIPETSASALKSTHNVYSHKSPLHDKTNTGKHVVTESPKKKSGWLWTITVIGVIAAGAGLGYLAYLLILANK